jgi:hypothetical protein
LLTSNLDAILPQIAFQLNRVGDFGQPTVSLLILLLKSLLAERV